MLRGRTVIEARMMVSQKGRRSSRSQDKRWCPQWGIICGPLRGDNLKHKMRGRNTGGPCVKVSLKRIMSIVNMHHGTTDDLHNHHLYQLVYSTQTDDMAVMDAVVLLLRGVPR